MPNVISDTQISNSVYKSLYIKLYKKIPDILIPKKSITIKAVTIRSIPGMKYKIKYSPPIATTIIKRAK